MPLEPEIRFIAHPSLAGAKFRLLKWQAKTASRRGGVPLLLLHGFTQSARSFQEVAEELVNKHDFEEVFAVDQRGHGESFWSDDYSRDAMREDLDFMTNALFGRREYVLGGMSMGGGVSAAFLGHPSSRPLSPPSKLVLIDWAPWSEDKPPSGVSKIVNVFNAEWNSFEDAVDQMCAFNPRRARENIESRLKHQLRIDKETNTYKWNTDPRIRESALLKAKESPKVMWEMIGNITVPTLLLRGSKSDVLDHERAHRLVHEALPSSTPGRLHVVQGAGHSVMGDKPVESAAAVAEWLRTHKL